jgi:hypothetical protein
VNGTGPKVELLWWEGCPSTEDALHELRAILREEGLDPQSVELHEVGTEDDAERERFVGSPTIRIDGREVAPPAEDEPVGLNCRVYRLRDGRVSPTPDPADVRQLVRRATGGRR